MVSIYKAKAKAQGPQHLTVTVERWDQEAQSIAYHDGKICFVQGALPGETVKIKLSEQKPQYFKGKVQSVISASALRIAPACPVAGQCGGCQLHYVGAADAVELKQQAVAQLLAHQLKLTDLPWQPAIRGADSGYRRKARIGIWYEKSTKQFQVGFRKDQSNEILAVSACMVLSPVIAKVLPVLQSTLPRLKHGSVITHAEVFDAEGQAFIIIRHIKDLVKSDIELLRQSWPEAYWYGEGEPDILTPWQDNTPEPSYLLTVSGRPALRLAFKAGDFIQVNATVNQQMVQQALQWLAPSAGEKILDLYCGIGNFSLPLAAAGATVLGVEGVPAMVQRARANAKANAIVGCEFAHLDLHLPWPKASWNQPDYQKVLLDPARAGAPGAIDEIARLKPAQILYVSCNPTTFARDAKVLLAKGYRIAKIGVMDMFPYTSHLELMALFTR